MTCSPPRSLGPSPRLFLGALLLLLACTTSSDRADRLEFWGLGREGEVVAELMPEFERRTGIKVDVQQIPWSAAHEKLLTAFVGEATPDVAQMGNTWIPEFVAIDSLEDLTARVTASDVVEQRDYFSGIWETNVIGPRVYGIPWYVDTRLLFYRSDILAAAGWAQPPRTWSEWLQAMTDVKERVGSDRWAIFIPTNEFEQPLILGMQAGSTILKSNDRFGAFSEAPFARAFDFYLELFRRGLAPRFSNTQVANLYQQFAEGDFAMYITGPWNVGEFRRRLPENLQGRWSTAPLPAPDGQPYPGVSVAGGSSLVIFKQSRRHDAAWKLIEFLSEPAQQVRFFELTGNLPARRSAWNAPAFVNDRQMGAFRTQLENVAPMPRVPELFQIQMSMTQFTDAAVRGQVTPQHALAGLDEKTNQILEKRRWVMARNDR